MTGVMTRAQREAEQIALWDNMEGVDQVTGTRELEPKIRLVGVPLIICRVTFRPEGANKRDYLSVEAVTAPAGRYDPEKIARVRASAVRKMPLPVIEEIGYRVDSYADPNSEIVFNDSSTGVRRQLVYYLQSKGLIDVGKKDLDKAGLDGEMGVNPFDTDVLAWKRGSAEATEGIDVKLLCPNGLRVSTYDNAFGTVAATYYLS